MNAEQAFTPEKKAQVEKAIAEAEERTSAEIVCAVATESGRYDRAEALAGIVFAIVLLSIANWLYFEWSREPGSFLNAGWLHPALQGFTVAIGFVAGNALASYYYPLRRLFTTRAEIREEVHRGAGVVFAGEGLSRTKGRGGLLIYVSLYEKQSVVLADDGIMKHYGQDFVDDLRDTIVNSSTGEELSKVLASVISRAAARLEEKLPCCPDDEDELPNHLLVIHPRP